MAAEMASYTPCVGTGQRATDARVMRSDSPKFFHLNGKVAAHCATCGKSVRVASLSSPITPMHKGI